MIVWNILILKTQQRGTYHKRFQQNSIKLNSMYLYLIILSLMFCRANSDYIVILINNYIFVKSITL